MLDTFEINNELLKLEEKLHDGIDFKSFLGCVDAIQQKALPQLESVGFPTDYAKVFLLKISNFLVGKYQFLNRHETLIAKPYAVFIDPSNNCPLHCPGCLHNSEFQKKIGPDWLGGNLDGATFYSFISSFGPLASNAIFYNWGEPLLNKKTPQFIRTAKSYLLRTSLSSNLSVDFDAEELVLSGLDYMVLSIDGVTKETYSKYRKGGNFNLAIHNVKKIVAAKKKFKKSMPWLSWQYLLFEHNKHEVEDAKQLAEELGVDEIRFSFPYDVLWDEEIVPAREAKEEVFEITHKRGGRQNCFEDDISLSEDFVSLYSESWSSKIDSVNVRKRIGSSCQWLYSTVVMDAKGRILPCCYVPRKDSGFSYVFSEGGDKATNYSINSELYKFSRSHFTWLSDLESEDGRAPRISGGGNAPYCVACKDRNQQPLVNDVHVKLYLKYIDKHSILKDESIEIISKWSGSK